MVGFKDFKKGFELSFTLAAIQFKERNEGSYLGILWYLLNPLLMFTLLLLIFGDRVGGSIEQYPLYLLLGIVTFNYFQRVTSESSNAIIVHKGIVKSVNFSRASLIFGIALAHLFSHIFELLLIAGFLLYFGASLSGLIIYPVVLFFFALFTCGVSFLLSALNVYFIDLNHIWTFITRLLWLGTPIFYSIGGQTRLYYVSLINPLYYFITIIRDLLIYRRISEAWMIGAAVFYGIVAFAIGFWVFNKLKRRFAELI